MRIQVGAVGRLKARAGAQAGRRLSRTHRSRSAAAPASAGGIAESPVSIAEIAESRAATADLRMADEAARLRAGLPDEADIALDGGGRDITSEEFAALIGRWRDGGTGTLAFFIGGPDGLAPTSRPRPVTRLAFGRMTWPHRLARIMLLEQIYRSVTILVNHPYHRM
jgi:23S rRNA (pseudouridine1915-N3)-methyltransferase